MAALSYPVLCKVPVYWSRDPCCIYQWTRHGEPERKKQSPICKIPGTSPALKAKSIKFIGRWCWCGWYHPKACGPIRPGFKHSILIKSTIIVIIIIKPRTLIHECASPRSWKCSCHNVQVVRVDLMRAIRMKQPLNYMKNDVHRCNNRAALPHTVAKPIRVQLKYLCLTLFPKSCAAVLHLFPSSVRTLETVNVTFSWYMTFVVWAATPYVIILTLCLKCYYLM